MAFIDTTPPQSADGTVAAMYLRQQRVWGYIPNYAKVFCHRPEVLARWGALLAEIRRPMDKRRFELVTFIAAYELGNSACAMAHGRTLGEFFSNDQIRAIAAGQCEGILTEAEQAMVAFARQVATDAQLATADQVAALRTNGYTDAEIFDIAATAAGRAFFAKLLDALGVQLDSAFLALDEPLRRVLTVGRPIDEAACETIEEQVEPDHVQP
jgi:alkylhydroperoxidase family enzyme